MTLADVDEALLAADRLKIKFVRHVSYELRQPLTNIVGFADLLREAATVTAVRSEATDSFGAVLLPLRGRTPTMPTNQSMLPTMDAYVRGGLGAQRRAVSIPSRVHAPRRLVRI